MPKTYQVETYKRHVYRLRPTPKLAIAAELEPTPELAPEARWEAAELGGAVEIEDAGLGADIEPEDAAAAFEASAPVDPTVGGGVDIPSAAFEPDPEPPALFTHDEPLHMVTLAETEQAQLGPIDALIEDEPALPIPEPDAADDPARPTETLEEDHAPSPPSPLEEDVPPTPPSPLAEDQAPMRPEPLEEDQAPARPEPLEEDEAPARPETLEEDEQPRLPETLEEDEEPRQPETLEADDAAPSGRGRDRVP